MIIEFPSLTAIFLYRTPMNLLVSVICKIYNAIKIYNNKNIIATTKNKIYLFLNQIIHFTWKIFIMGERLIEETGALVKYDTPILVAKQAEKKERETAKVGFFLCEQPILSL